MSWRRNLTTLILLAVSYTAGSVAAHATTEFLRSLRSEPAAATVASEAEPLSRHAAAD